MKRFILLCASVLAMGACALRTVRSTVKKSAAVLAVLATAATLNVSAGRADEANAKSLLK